MWRYNLTCLALLVIAAPPCSSLQLSTRVGNRPARKLPARAGDPTMESLLETIAPLALFPPMFLAFQALADFGSDRLGEGGMLDLEEASGTDKEKEPPKPLTDFLPSPSEFVKSIPNPFAPKYDPDFFKPLPDESPVYFPDEFDQVASDPDANQR